MDDAAVSTMSPLLGEKVVSKPFAKLRKALARQPSNISILEHPS
jgi:hypothetical protein